jgi:hypothetical protein
MTILIKNVYALYGYLITAERINIINVSQIELEKEIGKAKERLNGKIKYIKYMNKDKTIIALQNIKIKLLEDFIMEAARLTDLYGWVAEPEEMTKLDSLSKLLDDITEQIQNFKK